MPANGNTQMVEIRQLGAPEEEKILRDLISEYSEATGSKTAARVLQDWAGIHANIWVVEPKKT